MRRLIKITNSIYGLILLIIGLVAVIGFIVQEINK